MTRFDRRVHAVGPSQDVELVRYDREGKWYIEAIGEHRRVSIDEAVRYAVGLHGMDGVVHFGIPGGRRFDQLVRREIDRTTA